MKRLIILISSAFSIITATAQQNPLSENYFLDKYSLSPSYAGNYNPKFVFLGYRSDWTGIDGGPKTFRISYNDVFKPVENVGYGGKIIYDKAGIFTQIYILASYTYHLKLPQEHHILFGLSTGFYKNRLNLLDYYNDPNYSLDPSLINQDIRSKLKFMSDFSAVWKWQNIEAGFLFSNITFGDATYKEVNLKYNPLANFQFHATYNYEISEYWSVVPLAILRGGRYIKSQFELASQVIYSKRFWGSLVYRDPGIFGFGAGAKIDKGLTIGYNFNLATNVELGAFNNHEISLGFNIFEYLKISK